MYVIRIPDGQYLHTIDDRGDLVFCHEVGGTAPLELPKRLAAEQVQYAMERHCLVLVMEQAK